MNLRVLIALAPLGGGHFSVAQAIREALAVADLATEVTEVNVFSKECSRFPLTAIPALYPAFTVKWPLLWRWLYYGSNSPQAFQRIEALVQPLIRPGIRRALENCRPDIVVSVFPAIGRTLHAAFSDLGWRTPLGVVLVDMFSIHQAWLYPHATWYATPTPTVAAICEQVGIDKRRIHDLGLPLRRAFIDPAAPMATTLREKLEVPQNACMALLVTGGMRLEYALAVFDALLSSGPQLYPVAITGRDERAYRRLRHGLRGRAGQVVGFAADMADWLRAADILVGKAGPTMLAEAIQMGTPLALTGALPGQEEGNLDFVLRCGLGIHASSPRDIADAVASLVGTTMQVAAIRERMAPLRRPRAADELAALILDTATRR